MGVPVFQRVSVPAHAMVATKSDHGASPGQHEEKSRVYHHFVWCVPLEACHLQHLPIYLAALTLSDSLSQGTSIRLRLHRGTVGTQELGV